MGSDQFLAQICILGLSEFFPTWHVRAASSKHETSWIGPYAVFKPNFEPRIALTAQNLKLCSLGYLLAVGETVLGIELDFTWFVIFLELFVLLVALIHLIGELSSG